MSRKVRFGFWVDVAALFAFTGVAASGFALWAGREDAASLEACAAELLAMSRAGWVELHQLLAVLLSLLVSLHFALHFRWFAAMARRVVRR